MRRIALFAIIALGGLIVGVVVAQAASGTPKGKLAKVEQQLAELQTETAKISRLLDSESKELHPASRRIVVDGLAAAVQALDQVQSKLRAVRFEIKRPRNDKPAVEADVHVGSEDQPVSLIFNSNQHGDGDVSVVQKICVSGIVDYPNGVGTCDGGSEQIAVLDAVTLNPGRDGVPFPGRYEISIDCAKLHHKVPSLIVQPRDRDIVDEQTGRWLDNPWDWVVYDQSGVITPRQYGKSPGLMVFCHDWTITFTEVAQG